MTLHAILSRLRPACVALAAVTLGTAPAEAADPADVFARLTGFEMSVVDVPPDRPEQFATQVTIDGQPRQLNLIRVSVWAPNATVHVHRAGGVVEEMAPPTPNTYRGEVAGLPGSMVSAAIRHDGLHAIIWLPDDDVHGVIPLNGGGLHVVHREAEVISDFICPVDGDLADVAADAFGDAPAGDNPGEAGHGGTAMVGAETSTHVAELLVECDFDYYDNNFNSVVASVNKMAALVNNVNAIYERDVDITHVLTHAIVRTAEPDPYPSNLGSALLADFGSVLDGYPPEWFDLAMLFTGKDTFFIDNGVANFGLAGLAQANTICGGTIARVFVEQPGIVDIGATRVVAHEMGHVWNARHCGPIPDHIDPSCNTLPSPCQIMCAINGGCTSGGLAFGPCAAVAIINKRDAVSCLDPGTNGIQWVQWRSCGILCAENGLFSAAHNTLGEAADAVAAGGTVIMREGSSADAGGDETYPVLINKAMTLRAFNGSATVGN